MTEPCKELSLLYTLLRGNEHVPQQVFEQIIPEVLLQQCRKLGVVSLLFERLQATHQWMYLPANLQQIVLDETKKTVVIDPLRTRELTKVLQEAVNQSIDLLVIKGTALAYSHYPTPASRQRCDIDVWIHPGKINAMIDLMTSIDYIIIDPYYRTHQFIAYKVFAKRVQLTFDIHWRVSNDPEYAQVMSHDEAMTRSINLMNFGTCKTLCLADSLLLACLHLTHNRALGVHRLYWVYDIHLLIESMDDEQLLAFTDKALVNNLQISCLQSIQQSIDHFHTKLPKRILALLKTPLKQESLSQRFKKTYLGLIYDDCRALPNNRSKCLLLKELFFPFPSARHMKYKYSTYQCYWLPFLYLCYIRDVIFNRCIRPFVAHSKSTD